MDVWESILKEVQMLTKTGYNKILQRILETSGLNDELESDLQSLMSDFDEREGFLGQYGTVQDGEDIDVYDYVGNSYDTPTDAYKGQYEELKKKYIERFFGGAPTEETVETTVDAIMDETTEDVKRDGEEQTFDDLLQKVEG